MKTLKEAKAAVEASKERLERQLQEFHQQRGPVAVPRLTVQGSTLYSFAKKSSKR